MLNLSDDFRQKMLTYSGVCIDSCTKESEDAIVSVGKIIDILVQDGNRISKMSTEALAVLEDLRSLIERKIQKEVERDEKKEALFGILLKLSHEDADVNSFVPIILETLQFQDRIQQQLNNIKKGMVLWHQYRGIVPEKAEEYNDFLMAFGNDLLKVSTTEEERIVIRKYIPGLPAAVQVESNEIFFM